MNLVKYYQDNINDIYRRVTTLYQRGQPAYESDVDVPKLELIKPPQPADKLNRSVYLWTIDCIKQLETVVNALIGVYNDSGIIDYDVGDTAEIHLWLPRRLVIDDIYIAKLSDNFETCKKLLSQLEEYLQPFLVGL